jgi:hypothetical protein
MGTKMYLRCCTKLKTNINTRSELFWGITQRIVVIPYRRFWSACLSHPLKVGPDRLTRNVGKELPLHAA